jgi:neutral ceramidase
VIWNFSILIVMITERLENHPENRSAPMRRFKLIAGGAGLVLLILIAAFIGIAGPWPVYTESNYLDADYYHAALEAVEKAAAENTFSDAPDRLQAGWAVRDITPEPGVPMGGYGARPNGKKSAGVHDPLYVKALVLSDGADAIAITGADMLQTLPNLTALVEERVANAVPVAANRIFYHTSHTHCGPGALAPGIAAEISYGEYDPAVVDFLAERFSQAIIEAHETMAPAGMVHGAADAPEYITNRTRDGVTDAALHYAVFEKDSGERCILTRYSAHPTVYGEDMLEFSAEYPGAMQRFIEKETGATAIFLGGAVGSMGPEPPPAATEAERVEAMGKGLAVKLLENLPENPEFKRHVEIAGFSFTFGMPQFQARPVKPSWRLSPVLPKLFGLLPEGRIQAARIGDMMLAGTPFDFSGETSADWQKLARERGISLWPTSHSGAYLGYLSPDRYYNDVDEAGNLDYETGLMSWFGPDTEACITDLFVKSMASLTPGQSAHRATAR